jgi:hypothetical protein
MRHAAGNMQRTTNDMHRATGNMSQTSSNMQRTATTCNATCNMQRATCSMQQTTWNLERTIDNRQQRQQATRQHAACSRQRGIWKTQSTTGNKATCNKATCSMQHTPRRRRQNQATHATDNVHQAADDMQEDASTCELQRETHGTAAYRVRRAAGSGQPAACAKHCTRRSVRNTSQTPHTRCDIRPVPQNAASTRGTDTTQQALKRTR